MTDQDQKTLPQFYLTTENPCPYLESRTERKIFTVLEGEDAARFHNELTRDGFRRSQRIAYKPACAKCQECISVRIPVDAFDDRKFRKIMRLNKDLWTELCPAETTSEQYDLLQLYLSARHDDGGMSEMTVFDYKTMVQETPVNTKLIEYRPGSPISACDRPLVAACLTDFLDDGLSMVYSFFDPSHPSRSLGTYMILDHINLARKHGLPYLYLGYWIENCPKMSYKNRFRPLEHYQHGLWTKL